MKKRIVRAEKIGGSYSTTTCHAVEAGGFLFVTGQVANRPGTKPAPGNDPSQVIELGGVEEQTVQVMENLKAILQEAGTDFDHVVKRNVYITHLADFKPVYDVMARYFTTPVASTGVLTGLVPPSGRVEVDVIAVIPS